jgi:predicted DNA-binding transcriptional regulator YafY
MRDVKDPMDRFWTIEQAMAHLKVSRRTIERYVKGGLRIYFPAQGGYLDRDELLAEVRARLERQLQTRGK